MSRAPLHALTLWPEWAWAICHADKRVENRDYPAPAAQVGGLVAIHAGKHPGGRPGRPADHEALASVERMARRCRWEPVGAPGLTLDLRRGEEQAVLGLEAMTRSAIVAVARLAEVVKGTPDEAARLNHLGLEAGWGVPGAWWWRLDMVRVLREPVPCGGAQGFWRVKGLVLDQVREQWRRAA